MPSRMRSSGSSPPPTRRSPDRGGRARLLPTVRGRRRARPGHALVSPPGCHGVPVPVPASRPSPGARVVIVDVDGVVSPIHPVASPWGKLVRAGTVFGPVLVAPAVCDRLDALGRRSGVVLLADQLVPGDATGDGAIPRCGVAGSRPAGGLRRRRPDVVEANRRRGLAGHAPAGAVGCVVRRRPARWPLGRSAPTARRARGRGAAPGPRHRGGADADTPGPTGGVGRAVKRQGHPAQGRRAIRRPTPRGRSRRVRRFSIPADASARRGHDQPCTTCSARRRTTLRSATGCPTPTTSIA